MSSNIQLFDWKEIDNNIRSLKTDQIVLIIDQNVWQLYSHQFKELLKIEGKQVILWKAPDGEKVKNINDYETCMEFLIEKGVHRKAHLIAIGGGAASDFSGFVAATILRGITWTVIPTTLLSMIDASIGGKVAINSKFGKNLIGAFHNPENIWMDFSFLSTLPEDEVESGKGELLKYCFLEKGIHEVVHRDGYSKEVIRLCAKYKQDLTDGDFREQGNRKVLNLGHTFGHAIEKIYSIAHGEAVVWGMAIVFILTEKKDYLEDLKVLTEKIEVGLIEPPWFQKSFPIEEIMNYVLRDKKKLSLDTVEIINIAEIGQPTIDPLSKDEIENKFKEKKDELRKFSF